jgi:2-oxoglutarate ferredoxin oxidoreductase subunit delta
MSSSEQPIDKRATAKVAYRVVIKKDKCKGCNLCVYHCPVKHLELSENLNVRGVRYACTRENTHCIGCGNCFYICPDACFEIRESE